MLLFSSQNGLKMLWSIFWKNVNTHADSRTQARTHTENANSLQSFRCKKKNVMTPIFAEVIGKQNPYFP